MEGKQKSPCCCKKPQTRVFSASTISRTSSTAQQGILASRQRFSASNFSQRRSRLRQGGTEVGGVVGHPVVVGGAEGIVLQVVEAQGVAEALPVVLSGAAHGQVAVRRLEGVVGGAGGVIVALAGLDLADGAVGHRGGLDAGVHGVLQGDIHQLADAPLLPVDEGQHHGGGQVPGGVMLRDAGAGLDGIAARACRSYPWPRTGPGPSERRREPPPEGR